MTGIYMIISPTARVYIGQAFQIDKRKRYYQKEKCKGQPRLFASIKKYGFKNHFFDVIEYCSVEDLNIRERFWQDEYEVLGIYGLNCKLTETNIKRQKYSDEARKKMSESAKGKVLNEETKLKIGLIWKGKKRGEFSKEHLQKLKDSHKGKIQTKELIQKRIEGRNGYKHSEETKRKMSEAAYKRNQNKGIFADLPDKENINLK